MVGTGDLSELALGWCTYGVGDHMSHYAVNASVPKTLIQHVIRWVAETGQLGDEASDSPARHPGHRDQPRAGPRTATAPSRRQDTEAVIGPYELQDFHLYYTLRFGYAPPKVAFLAYCAWRDAGRGRLARDRRRTSATSTTSAGSRPAWASSCDRFFRLSQFKRSASPTAPRSGSGGSLSPRGDYRAPSDGEATAWLDQLALIPDA